MSRVTSRRLLPLWTLLLLNCHAAPEKAIDWQARRQAMVTDQIEARGIRDSAVLQAMTDVERHLFVPEPWRPLACDDRALPIGHGQTISQPYVVALMSEALELRGDEKVLEIGTGSGYQAAILGKLAREIHSVEILPPLAEEARLRLRDLGATNVTVYTGDGHRGLPEEAPFDAIILTAAPQQIPPLLLEQLRDGGRLVAPIGPSGQGQRLIRVRRNGDSFSEELLEMVEFVPMTGND